MRIGTDKAAQIVRCLMEGMGIRSVSRLAGVSTNTVKVFAHGQDTGRYSPGQIIELKYKPIVGEPNMDDVCTSHVERNNLTMRLWNRRFTRLTMGFSKKLENHEAALGLYFACYNFVVKH